MNKTAPKRQGVWEDFETLTDPDSGLSVILSERIRGKPAYSIQLVLLDEMGPNKHIEVPSPKAKHKIEDIAYSLCKNARELIEARKAGV